jgi:lipoprotein-anchoring transpeptidase ErfK/SrfK
MSTLPTSTDNSVPPPPPPCGPEIRACVSLSTKQAWLMTNGVVDLGPVQITHGGTTNPTPTGTWPVAWKDQEHTSSIYGDPMPYSVFFAPGGIAFHEGRLDEDSHGCIRLDMTNAQTFFNSLQVGQLVQVVP